MTADQIVAMFNHTVMIIGPSAAFVIAAYKFFDTQKDKHAKEKEIELEKFKAEQQAKVAIAKENSAGAEAIMELVKEDKEIRKDMEIIRTDLEKKDRQHAEDVRRIATTVQEFTFKAITFLGGNLHKDKN